jgi:hypothetical protein
MIAVCPECCRTMRAASEGYLIGPIAEHTIP